jgi:hypothetical protein
MDFDIEAVWSSFGWEVLAVKDGNDVSGIYGALGEDALRDGRYRGGAGDPELHRNLPVRPPACLLSDFCRRRT